MCECFCNNRKRNRIIINEIMIYISDKDQDRIKYKISKLSPFFKRPFLAILFFQFLGTLLFTYGICMARYMHPISKRILNPTYQFLISCFYYFSLSVAAPFSGGHLNPAISTSLNFLHKNKQLKLYIFAQLVGALIGSCIAYLFFGVVPFYYWQSSDVGSLMLDFVGEAFGTFVYIFFILLVTQTNYMAGQYFRYLLLAIYLLAGRMFTLRKGCINPALALAMQLFAAIEKGNFLLFLPYSLCLIIGPFIGGLLAVIFFKNIYGPLKEGIARQKMQVSAIQQDP